MSTNYRIKKKKKVFFARRFYSSNAHFCLAHFKNLVYRGGKVELQIFLNRQHLWFLTL